MGEERGEAASCESDEEGSMRREKLCTQKREALWKEG